MKINKLNLIAYGHFTNKELVLDAEDRLHLVFGPNEAGKSTALRALSRFFFGFEHKSSDAFLHRNKHLAVGVQLVLPDGETLELTRWKRRKNDLVDETNQPVDPGFMTRIMSGMNQEMFASLFGISHNTLRLGGNDLLRSGGHLGRTLFAAASGIMHLREMQNKLQDNMDILFRPQAPKSLIMQKKNELDRLNRELRQACVRPGQWRELQENLTKAQREKTKIQVRLKDSATEHARHSRYMQALPILAKRRDLMRQLEELESVLLLNQEFSKRRMEIRADLGHALQERTRLENRSREILNELQNISIHYPLLELEPRIKTLQREVALVGQLREELERIRTKELDVQRLIREKSSLLGRVFSMEELENLAVTKNHHLMIQELIKERSALDQQNTQVRETMQDQAKNMRQARKELQRLPRPIKIDFLELVCKRLAAVPDLEEKSRNSREHIQTLCLDLERRVKSLGLWRKDPQELLSLPLPLPESISRMDEVLSQAQRRHENASREVREIQQAIEDRKNSLRKLDQEQPLPGPEALHDRRALRDQGWRLVRKSWLENREDSAEIKSFLDNTGCTDLASGFEAGMRLADETADIMLEKSGQLARSKALREEIQAGEQELSTAWQELEQARQEEEEGEKKWQELWANAGINPLSPREMQGWLGRVQEIIRLAGEKQTQERVLEKAHASLDALFNEGLQALEQAGYSDPRPADVQVLAQMMEKILDEIRQAGSRRALLQQEADRAYHSLRAAARKQRQILREASRWRRKWKTTLESMGLNPERDPETVQEEIEIRQEIYTAWSKLQGLGQRRSELGERLKDFQERVDQLARQLGRTFEQTPAGEVLAVLSRELEQEQEKLAGKKFREKELRQTAAALDELNSRIAAREKELDLLCREAGAVHPDELPELEQKSQRKRELSAEAERLEDILQDLAGGQDLQEFMSQAGSFQVHELQAGLEELEAEKERLEKDRDQFIARIAGLEKELQEMDGTSRAAEIRQQIHEVRAELEQEVLKYVELRLSKTVLDAQMEHFRKASQGPVLDMAGQYLESITMGSLSAVYADYDSRGDPVLKAQRPDGTGLGMEELSDGSRDQLFLALRLAGLNHYLEHNPPFPFTVDDILVHFDDRRAGRTLSLLAGLACKTQIIFFTHHRHLVDLARKNLDPRRLQVHEL